MSRNQIDRIRALERQLAELSAAVRELQARPPIVINNPAPQVFVQPAWPTPQPAPWAPPFMCGTGDVGFAGQVPSVALSNVAH